MSIQGLAVKCTAFEPNNWLWTGVMQYARAPLYLSTQSITEHSANMNIDAVAEMCCVRAEK